MVRIARERVDDLFALAEKEAANHQRELADRYVRLARRIGMRYNLRFLPEYRELYCQGCSAYWVEGSTVRTRLTGGRRTRTCLVCGRRRRTRLRPPSRPRDAGGLDLRIAAGREDEALVGPIVEARPKEPPDEDKTEEE
jgi:RNase P subunit RPR2